MVISCGCYHTVTLDNHIEKLFLPQVNVAAHTVILSNASTTTLTQTFVNPSKEESISECKYVFPLFDGVSVVGFNCELEDRVIRGVVKEKFEAKQIYIDAVESGQTAGLLEQGPTSDVFMTTLGNIAAGARLLVKITYVGELKHDMGANGIRYTLPTMISPRYGGDLPSGDVSSQAVGGISMIVDINMPKGCPIQEVRSPSHPIALTLGKTSTALAEVTSTSRASATLTLGTVALDKDFILEIVRKDDEEPRALLETHADLSGQRALMVSLVPKLPSTNGPKPEIMIVADQSGSMRGPRTKSLVAALKIFLKSLPVGIKFNICSFGSSQEFCFAKSQDYNISSLGQANDFVEGFSASQGGTETLAAVKAAVESRDSVRSLSIILATDGDITQQQTLFDYINEQTDRGTSTVRVFPLGIGDSVSSALVEGVARAGNGFAQSVTEGEKQDKKIIKMLKGALTPESGAYTLEIQYRKDENDDDFELVERVTDSLRVMIVNEPTTDGPGSNTITESAMIVSEDDVEDTPMAEANTDKQRDDPIIPPPKLLQTPQKVPPLYPSSRTTVYILRSPSASSATPESVILRNDSKDNPFEVKIPVENLPQPGTTIHSLAAKRAILELEEGRGWLTHAKDSNDQLIKDTHSAGFAKMVEAEAVRLGTQYQIAGKWTSFVAIETKPSDPSMSNAIDQSPIRPPSSQILAPTAPYAARQHNRTSEPARKSTGGLPPRMQLGSQAARQPDPISDSILSLADPQALSPLPQKRKMRRMAGPSIGESSRSRRILSFEDQVNLQASEETDPLQKLVALQAFEGYWLFDEKLVRAVGAISGDRIPEGLDPKIWGTMLAVSFLRLKMLDEEEAWGMIVGKALDWLSEQGFRDAESERWWREAREKFVDAESVA